MNVAIRRARSHEFFDHTPLRRSPPILRGLTCRTRPAGGACARWGRQSPQAAGGRGAVRLGGGAKGRFFLSCRSGLGSAPHGVLYDVSLWRTAFQSWRNCRGAVLFWSGQACERSCV
jgi:hypothetical protein